MSINNSTLIHAGSQITFDNKMTLSLPLPFTFFYKDNHFIYFLKRGPIQYGGARIANATYYIININYKKLSTIHFKNMTHSYTSFTIAQDATGRCLITQKEM